jgi:hypothetical protein
MIASKPLTPLAAAEFRDFCICLETMADVVRILGDRDSVCGRAFRVRVIR